MKINPLDHLGLVRKIALPYARRWSERGLDIVDTDEYQDGVVGLLVAVDKYDPSRGTRFSTHAYWWIRHHVQKGVVLRHNLVILPGHRWVEPYKVVDRELTNVTCSKREAKRVDDADELEFALNRVHAKNRQLIISHYSEGNSLQELARQSGVSKTLIDQAIKYGLKRVRAAKATSV